ncbi:hypothetical protein PM10SUCC1_13890 [Propionigenium maris DSM 9537]|uniref:Tetratricopeptide repeat protein n=1 Tax=Propionigenium maris DSM 9537 TaxID=1123000 RepID=A0A9W6GKZ3_9FUSO|nr:tetratricopeptide repeat protein [Propionigenium maris]GLI55875.1 hypothetical protein PM10SUCC1_13890 [Propionigenium maris DSM 9537]
MKRKITLIALLAVLSSAAFANERDDIRYIDELYKNRNYKVAVMELESFLEKYPTSRRIKDIQLRLAKTYFLEKDYEKSKKYFDIVLINHKPRRSELEEINLYQVKNTAHLKKFEEAGKYLQNIPRGREYDEAVFALGLAYYNAAEYNKAQGEFTKLLTSKGDKYSQAILYLALSSYNNSQYVRSIVYLDEYYNGNEKDKNYPLMNYIYGSCYFKMDDMSKAEGYFKEVVEKYPDNIYATRSQLSLLSIYREQRNEAAMVETLTALEGTSGAAAGYKIMAEYSANKGDYAGAAEYYSKIPAESRDDHSKYGYSFSLYRKGDKEGALKSFGELKGTEFESEYLYYTALINYEAKRYGDVLTLKPEVEKAELKSSYRENINSIIANSAYEIEDYTTAREYYLKVYKKTYQKDELYRVIIADSKLGDLEDLDIRFTEYKKTFVKDQQYRRDIYLAAGAAYYNGGQVEKAKAAYAEYLKSNRDTEISENMVGILLNERDYEGMERYLKMQDRSPENTYLLGIAAFGKQDYSAAEGYFKSAAASSDKEIAEKGAYNLVRTYSRIEENDKTVEAADEYIAAGYTANKGNVVDRKALAYFRMGEYEKSRKIYEELSAIESFKEYALFQVGETYFNERSYDEAVTAYGAAYMANPKGEYAEDSRYWEINALKAQGKDEETLEKIGGFLTEYPKSGYRNNLLLFNAEIYAQSGSSREALDSYKKLYEESEDAQVKERALENLVKLSYDEGLLEDSRGWSEKLADDEAKVYWSALIHEKNGEVNLAHQEYEKLLESEGYGDRAAYNLATYYYGQENLEEAQKYYRMVEASGDSFYKDTAVFQLGVIAEKNGDNNAALRNYTKVSLLYKDSPLREGAIIKTASTYEKLGDEAEAMNTYREFVGEFNSSQYTDFAYEKLISLNLKNEDANEAKVYYVKLGERSPEKSKKYDEYFNKGE